MKVVEVLAGTLSIEEKEEDYEPQKWKPRRAQTHFIHNLEAGLELLVPQKRPQESGVFLALSANLLPTKVLDLLVSRNLLVTRIYLLRIELEEETILPWELVNKSLFLRGWQLVRMTLWV